MDFDIEKMADSDLNKLIKEATQLREARKQEKSKSKKAKINEYGDYFEASYKYMKLNDLFWIKIDNKNQVKIKFKNNKNSTSEICLNYMTVIERLTVLYYIVTKLADTQNISSFNCYEDELGCRIDDYYENDDAGRDEIYIQINFKTNMIEYSLYDYDIEVDNVECAAVSDPKCIEKTKKDIDLKIKALQKMKKLQRNFIKKANYISRLKV